MVVPSEQKLKRRLALAIKSEFGSVFLVCQNTDVSGFRRFKNNNCWNYWKLLKFVLQRVICSCDVEQLGILVLESFGFFVLSSWNLASFWKLVPDYFCLDVTNWESLLRLLVNIKQRTTVSNQSYRVNHTEPFEVLLELRLIRCTIFSKRRKSFDFDSVLRCLNPIDKRVCSYDSWIHLKEKDPCDKNNYESRVNEHVKDGACTLLTNPVDCLRVKSEVGVSFEVSNGREVDQSNELLALSLRRWVDVLIRAIVKASLHIDVDRNTCKQRYGKREPDELFHEAEVNSKGLSILAKRRRAWATQRHLPLVLITHVVF